MPRGPGLIQQKLLLLLKTGAVLLITSSSSRQMWVMKQACKELENINRRALDRSIRRLYQSKLVSLKELEKSGEIEMVLTRKGKEKALRYNPNSLSVKGSLRWDGKWRIIAFDIPKAEKKARDAFRFHLRRLGFQMLQKSLFVFPYPCEDEIDFLVELYGLQQYVRRITTHEIDIELHLKKNFDLL